MNKTQYRNSTQIVCDLLDVTQDAGQDGIAVTHMCRKANLSHGRLKNFLNNLTSSGLMNEITYDGKNAFVVTPKGIQFLDEYKKFHEFAGSFGLEM